MEIFGDDHLIHISLGFKDKQTNHVMESKEGKGDKMKEIK